MYEVRGQPTAADIKVAVEFVKKLPDAGDHGHVQAVFPIEDKALPAVPANAWDDAKTKTVKFARLFATNQQLDRVNLIWHLQHPGQGRYQGARNTHPQVLKMTSGDRAIVDGHHRLSALKILGLAREQCWVLNAKKI